jgi:hypothetical protein
MHSLVPSLFDYKLSPESMGRLGHIVITFSHAAAELGRAYSRLNPDSTSGWRDRLDDQVKFLRLHVRDGNNPEIADLVRELRWVTKKTVFARNMIAHGILLYAENGDVSFWSHERRRELALQDVLNLEPCFNYMLWVSVFINWSLAGIRPHKPLPVRPSS